MTLVPSYIIPVLIWITSQLILGADGKPKIVHMETHCNNVIRFYTSKILNIQDWSLLPSNGTSCAVGFLGYSPYHKEGKPTKVRVSVLSVSVPGTNHWCNESRVDIIDSDNITYLSGKGGICGEDKGQCYDTTKDTVYIHVTSSNATLQGKVKILVSAYNTETCDTKKEYCCDNGRCVADSLKCDGYNDCGDNSDEEDGCLLSTLVIVLIVVGSGMVVIIMVFISATAFKRRWRNSWGVGPSMSQYPINSAERKPFYKKIITQDKYGAT